MRVLCVSAQLPGHLDWGGYLLTAAELCRRRHTVLWASGAEVQPLVSRAGIPFRALTETGWRWPPPPPLESPPNPGDAAWQQQRAVRALDQWLDEPRVEAAVRELDAVMRTFRPDVLVSEMFIAAGAIVAELAGVPFVVAGWPAAAPVGSNASALAAAARARLDRLLAATAAKGLNWTASGPPALCSAHLHVTYWSPTWYRGQAMLAQTRHVGGRAAEPSAACPSLPPPDGRPWVLITLGTSFNDDPNFFVAAAHATDRLGCLPIIVLGKAADAPLPSWLARLPRASIVLNLVEFSEVLPYTAAAIHHGGAGLTHALVRHAVPQIVVPHAADQIHQALGVARSGVGVHLPPKQATLETLTAALAAILPDLAPARAGAVALQTEFAELGGVDKAATLIEEVRG